MMDYLLTFFLVILVFAVLFIALQAYVFVTGIRTVKSVNRAANAYADSRKAAPVAPHSDTVLVDVKATLLDRDTGGVIAEEIFIKKFPFRDFVDDSEGSMGGVRVVLGPLFNDGRGPRCSGSFDAVYRKDLFDTVCDALEQDGWKTWAAASAQSSLDANKSSDFSMSHYIFGLVVLIGILMFIYIYF